MPIRRRLQLFVLATCCLLATSAAAAEGPVDFHRDVAPLLQARCVKCHGPQKMKGGLRLDSRQAAEAGGTSGQNLLQEPAATNELLRRITTPDKTERMPLEGQPLSADEVALVKAWLEQGAPWPDEVSSESGRHYAQPPKPWLDRWLPFVQTTLPAWYTGLVVLLALLLIERARLQLARSRQASGSGSASPGWLTRQLARVPRLTALVGLLLAVAWGLSLLLARSQHDLATVTKQLVDHQRRRAAASPPEPPSQLAANHPPRLGGEYYRGNDERSPKLYNGGFYRTATMNVQLVGSDGKPCKWLDPYPAEPRIELTVERAPQATPNLFTEKIMAKAFLTAVRPVDLANSGHDYRLLQTVVPGDKWLAAYELPACANSERLRGQLFLYSDRGIDEEKLSGLPHYRIDYDFWVQDGVIESRSRLAMVSLYQPGNLSLTPANHIMPDEWFDFRPIPVIEGEPSTDPVLLGIPENVDLGQDATVP
ncbi:MAG: hypothetical protein L0211_22590 [Planctomycetaceae bacterium]|nr:hypothetical protein [Planctomycetaceae bacterium]